MPSPANSTAKTNPAKTPTLPAALKPVADEIASLRDLACPDTTTKVVLALVDAVSK